MKKRRVKLILFCDPVRHLICWPYSIPNLHRMAQELGIKRHWFHRDHYDIPKRRVGEIMALAEIVSSRRIWEIVRGPWCERFPGCHCIMQGRRADCDGR